MFTLPRSPNGTAPDELPVMHISEDAVILNSLISMLYLVPPEIPDSSDDSLACSLRYDQIFYLLEAEISRKKLSSSTRAGLFHVYATAHSKRLIPEVAIGL
jgi:hypothetical protein